MPVLTFRHRGVTARISYRNADFPQSLGVARSPDRNAGGGSADARAGHRAAAARRPGWARQGRLRRLYREAAPTRSRELQEAADGVDGREAEPAAARVACRGGRSVREA